MNNHSFPTREQLALIAAATQRANPTEAVQHALALWHEAGETLEAVANNGVPLPPKFPATLDDFLRIVVAARTPADATKRLRDFYTEEHARPLIFRGEVSNEDFEQAGKKASYEIQGWKDGGFRDAKQWRSLASRYLLWWTIQKSVKAQASALKRGRLVKIPVLKKHR